MKNKYMKFPKVVKHLLPVSYMFTEKENFICENNENLNLPTVVQVSKYSTSSFVPRPFYKSICNILTV